jgi:hypothetical protein
MTKVNEGLRARVRAEAVAMAQASGGLINLNCGALCQRAGVPSGQFAEVMGQGWVEFVGEVRGDSGIPLYPVGPSRSSRAAHPLLRRDQILGVALTMASGSHYMRITRDEVARTAGVAAGSVTRYFGDMTTLRAAVLRAAVDTGAVDIVAQGILERDPVALGAPAQVLAGARAHLSQLCQK